MGQKSLTSSDRRVAFSKNNSLNTIPYGTTEQVVSITDIISEGPIGGLVNGGKSIFLNNDPLFEDEDIGYSGIEGESVSGSFGSTTVTVNNFINDFNYDPQAGGESYLGIHNLYTFNNITNTNFLVSGGGGQFAVPTGVLLTFTFTADPGDYTVSPGLPSALITNTKGRLNASTLSDGDGVARIVGNNEKSVTGTISSITNPSAGNSYTGTIEIFIAQLPSFLDWIADSNTTLELQISQWFLISSVNSSQGTITLSSETPALAYSNKDFTISRPVYADSDNSTYTQKYESSSYQFVSGTIDQPLIQTLQGVGSSTVALSAGQSLARGTGVVITSTGAQAAEIDSVTLNFNYPGGLYLTNTETGKKEGAGAGYRIELSLRTSSGPDVFDGYIQLEGNQTISSELATDLNVGGSIVTAGESIFSHGGKFPTAVTFSHTINLEDFQPYSGFRIRVTRVTNSDNITDTQTGRGHQWGRGASDNLRWRGSDVDKWQAVQSSQLSQVLGVIKEKLNYPYTAIGNVTFNAKEYSDTPSRTYECYGLKVFIPNNYTTREQAGLNSDGSFKDVKDLYNGIWTGTFSSRKVYTDNPAWIFYDILTNNRYGVGEFIQDIDIDKYSLYKIARYCDELVPDGKGGLEPRFRANLYLQKSTDIFKVMKDMATIFRAMLFWTDGQLTPVIDEKRYPIYNFNRTNVIDGAFEYQGTSSRTRTNQIVVSWNNPQSDYKLEPLIVEDRENIINTGQLIKETATAFGCTSEGQAIRYGRWKLWTAINQTEIVSFKSAINSAFLAPGDVINIQDEHDFKFKYSGRIVSASVANSDTSIIVDRVTDAEIGDTVALLVPKSKIVLAQRVASINGTDNVSAGDEVTQARDENGLLFTLLGSTVEDTQENINNAYDDGGNLLSLQYNQESSVEEYTITNVIGDTIVIDEVLSNLSDLTGQIWGVKDTTAASYKEYRIVSIVREADNTYGITAVEYYEGKFDTIENNFSTSVEDPLYPNEVPSDKVPAPSGLRVLRTPKFTSPGEEIVLQWDSPLSGTIAFQFIAGYEIRHNIPGYPSTIRVTNTSFSFDDVPDGFYSFSVRTITRKNRKSRPAIEKVYIEDIFGGSYPRLYGLVQGGYVSAPITINTTANVLKFETDPVYFYPFTASSGSSTAFNNLSLDYSGLDSTAEVDTAYLFIDISSQQIKLVNFIQDTLLNLEYWYDQLAFNINSANIWQNLSGTVTVSAGKSKVVGSGTNFTSLSVTNIIKFSATQAARIAYIESDTELYIDRVFNTNITSVTAQKDSLSPDYTRDFLAGTLSDNGDWQSFMVLDPDIIGTRGLIADVNVAFINYDSEGTQTSTYSDITLTATALNFREPEFKVTGTGFTSTSGSPDTAFFYSEDGTFAKELNGSADILYGDGGALNFTVEVRERQDPTNTDKQISKNISVVKIQDGSIGLDGKTVELSAEDYSVIYNGDGTTPVYNGSSNNRIDFSATARNFTSPLYRFDVDGSGFSDWDSIATSFYTVSNTFDSQNWPVRVEVEAAETPDNWDSVTQTPAPTTSATDSISIVGVKSGTGGVVIVNSNNSHSYTTDRFGDIGTGTTAVIPNSGTTLEVLIGGVVGNYSGNPTTIGGSTSNKNDWYISGITSSSGGDVITNTTISESNNVVTVGEHTMNNSSASNPTDDTEIITYTIVVNIDGTDVTLTSDQSLSKSRQGLEGRQIIELFQETSTNTEPASLPAITYDFSTNTPSIDTANGWSFSSGGVNVTNKYGWKVSTSINPDPNNASVSVTSDVGNWNGPILVATFGDVGTDARAIKLSADKYVIKYDELGGESDQINFTTEIQGVEDTAYYVFSVDGVQTQPPIPDDPDTTDTFTLPENNEPAVNGAPVLVKVDLYEGTTAANAVLKASDSVNIYAVQDGSDSITGFLTNAAHVVSADKDGTVSSFTGAGGTFRVFKGSTNITTNCDFSLSSSTGVTAAINAGTGVYSVSGMSGDQGTATFEAVIPGTQFQGGTSPANDVTITADYSISKSKTGEDGESITGANGDAALREVSTLMYYTAGVSPADPVPTAPSDVSGAASASEAVFDFDSFSFSANAPSGWSFSAPTFTPLDSNGDFYKYYAVSVVFKEAGSGTPVTGTGDTNGNGGLIDFGTVRETIGFTGLVTFSGSTLKWDSADYEFNYTAIDGAWITTGKVTGPNLGYLNNNAGTITTDANGVKTTTTEPTSLAQGNNQITYTSSGMEIDFINSRILSTNFYVNPSITGGAPLAGFKGNLEVQGNSTVTGNLKVGSGTDTGVSINASDTDGEIVVGSGAGFVKILGNGQKIVINDGTTDRVILGKLS